MKTWIVSYLGCRNYSRVETIQGRKLFAEIRYHIVILKSYHFKNVPLLVLLAVLVASTHCRQVPKVLQKINKALGLPKKSEVLWDILRISDINTKVEENVADLNNVSNVYATHCVINPKIYWNLFSPIRYKMEWQVCKQILMFWAMTSIM